MADSKIGTLVKAITYTDTTSISVGYLPPNSVIISADVAVGTLFNSGGADYVDIGTSSSAAAYADNINVATAGYKTGTLTGTGAVVSATASSEVKAVYIPAATSPSAGSGYVIVKYVQL